MDEIEDFFNFTKEFKRQTMPRGAVSGNIQASVNEGKSAMPIKREFKDSRYALAKAEEERRRMEELEMGSTSRIGMETMDDMEIDGSDDEAVEAARARMHKIDDGVYSRYPFDLQRETKLPIYESRERILRTIKENPVVVLEGDTGCGKTTQVPQYIIDDAYRNNVYCKICITQPRRIAAISIAQRVSKERKWECGKVVGFKVGLYQQSCEDTRIVYCTTGVLLQQLISEKSLNQYTHIILDEVHERDQDMDFLLIVVRRMLSTVSKHVKIILMSATIDTKQFANYFKIGRQPAPSLRVDTRRMFSVKEYYLNSLARINKNCITVNYEDPSISFEMYNLALRLVLVIENIESTEMENNPHCSNINASILIFLPGINEINEMAKLLEGLNEKREALHIKLYPIRLHSMVDPEEQCKIFRRSATGYRKVILATNIAESSITVPDVKYVIDFCLTKFLKTDSSTNFSSLVLSWASKANCRQRSGRAGRVMNGRVYRLVPKEFYDTMMDDFSTPEMLRCPLENIVLKSKLLDMGAPTDVLALAMDPPNLSDIQNTILSLKEIGALFSCVGKDYSPIDGDLTFMGRVMSALPLDVRFTRLILLGYMFSCLEETIIIAAGLSVRSVFISTNKQQPAEPYIRKLTWADASGSDLFAIYKAYRVWENMKKNRHFKAEEDEISWAKRFCINLRGITEMNLTINEIKSRLKGFQIDTHSYNRVQWVEREMSIVLKVVIAGAFYPHYFTRSSLNDLDRERSMYHILCGRDPCTTVYFTGFSTRNIGQLYTKAIKNLFKEVHIPAKDIEVNFQPGSERVFVTFKSNDKEEAAAAGTLMVPGHVCSEVYKAVRMRMENLNTTINTMEARQAIAYAEKEGLGRVVEGVWMPKMIPLKNAEVIVLPSVFHKTVRVQITHIESCSKFFARPLTELARTNEITEQLNCREMERCCFEYPKEVATGMLLAARFEDKYHRARVLGPMPAERKKNPFKVYFIDYGNSAIVDFSELRYFSGSCEAIMMDTPPRIFECRLANVQPSTMHTALVRWRDEAMELLQHIADHNPVDLHIFSVVSFVASVIIQTNEGSLNELLIKKGYARVADESYLSKMDHDLRRRKQACSGRFLDHDHIKQNEEYIRSMHTETCEEVESPPHQLCMRRLNLRGPFSPVETKVYSAIRIGHWKTVTVERDSVNSVLIDTDPQDIHDRLMVAASVTETCGQSTMTLRQTTLMPNIHGFGALATMMFAPQFQLKCNKTQSKYVSLLAGLGYHKDTMKPYFEEHDIVLTLDIEVSEKDLESINHLRYCMDTMLFTHEGETHPAADEKARSGLQAKIKELLISIFSCNRQYIEAHMDKNDSVWEQQLCKIGHPCIYSPRSIFPTLTFPDIMDEKFENINILSNHCKQLHQMAQFDAMVQGGTTCRLCNLVLENIVQLRIHLLSQLHRDRERQIHFDKTKN